MNKLNFKYMLYKIRNYQDKLDLKETLVAIKFLKDNFENILSEKLNLKRVSAPLFVIKKTGLNDDLNGYERAIDFNVSFLSDKVEIVQSLAKWKRYALKKYDFNLYEGIYSDMNAIRKDEIVDNIHSIYVDQWDWEKIIRKEDRNLNYLFSIVNDIYDVLKDIEKLVNKKYPILTNKLPEKISFISSKELYGLYPNLNSKQREYEYLKKHRAAFIYQIGYKLDDNLPHDGRAADYDDWNLNGDILVFDEVLDSQLELSSMGIRVDRDALIKQSEIKNELRKLTSPYAMDVINETLPFTIGGGIGQSRICLFFLEKLHVGQVQSSIWPKEDIEKLLKNNIKLL